MFKIEGNKISMNRGDQASIQLTNESGFSVGDKIKFSIVQQNNYGNVKFQKTYTVDEDSTDFVITLDPDDTRFGNLIRTGFETYWYELELNGCDTVVGYDGEGPKEFILYPEAPGEE